MQRRLTSAALAATLSLLTLAGCSTSDGEASSSTTTGPTTTEARAEQPTDAAADAPPAVGDCLEPTTQSIADGHRLPEIAPCDAPHGGEIVDVYTIDAGEDGRYPAAGTGLVGVDDLQTRCYGDDSHPGAVGDFVGPRKLELSDAQQDSTGLSAAYLVSGIQTATFVPGPAAWARGERWFVCAAVLSNSLERPSTYSGSLRDALKEPGAIAAELTWCKTQASNERTDFIAVPCTEPHNYEQLVAFDAGAPDAPDPGDAALGDVAESLCPALSSLASAGRTDDLDEGLGLGWTYPLPSEWANGERTVRCFVVTLDDGLTTGSAALGTAEPVA